ASQVQVDFFIPEVFQLLSRAQEIIRAVREDLRHCPHPLIMLRQDVFLLPGAEMSHLIRSDKGDKIFVKSSETFMYGASEDPSCDPLQRGEINFHNSLLSCC